MFLKFNSLIVDILFHRIASRRIVDPAEAYFTFYIYTDIYKDKVRIQMLLYCSLK